MFLHRISMKNISVVVYLIMSVLCTLLWFLIGGKKNILHIMGASSLFYSYGFGLFAPIELGESGIWITVIGWVVFIPLVLVGLILSTVKALIRKNYKPFLAIVGVDNFILVLWLFYKIFILKDYFGWLNLLLEIVFHLIYFVLMFYLVRKEQYKG